MAEPLPSVDGISLAVSPGSCVGVVGANGAGKSSLLKSIAGVVRSEEGRVRLDGADVRNASPWTMARRGVRLVPESKELFWGLSVGENLRVGARAVPAHGRRESIEAALEVFPRLRRLNGSLARSLSGGEQQMLAIARALAGEPRLLLLDEPALGLAPAIVAQLVDSLRHVRTRGMSILLAEQNLAVPRQLCDEVAVWQLGHVIATGSPHDVLSEDVLRTAFLVRAAETRRAGEYGRAGGTPSVRGRTNVRCSTVRLVTRHTLVRSCAGGGDRVG